jgi:hypothetical protein
MPRFFPDYIDASTSQSKSFRTEFPYTEVPRTCLYNQYVLNFLLAYFTTLSISALYLTVTKDGCCVKDVEGGGGRKFVVA